MKFGDLLLFDGINLLTSVTSQNKLLDILCYPFQGEPFEYFGPSAIKSHCISVLLIIDYVMLINFARLDYDRIYFVIYMIVSDDFSK